MVMVLSASLVFACAARSTVEPVVRPAVDAPELFLVQQAGILSRVPGTNACLTPLFDPRDHSQIVLVRSSADGTGDYRIAEERYSVGAKELIRIDCRTGSALGVVRR